MKLASYDIQAKEIMAEDFIKIKKGSSIEKISDMMMKNTKKEIFIVDEANNIRGIITLKDLYNICHKNRNSLNEFLKRDIIYIKPEDSLRRCRDLMVKEDIGRLPVIRNSRLVGVIRQEHIRNFLYMRIEKIGVLLKYIINNISEAICLIDEEGRVLIWNNNAEDLYGITSEEIEGELLQDFFPDAIDVKILETREAVKNIYHTPRKGSHIIISAVPIYIKGKFIGVVSTDRDISEVKKMQEELKQANDLIEFLQKEIEKNSDNNFGNVVGQSKAIKEKIDMSKRVAKSSASILITGESGTGKEVFARAIHDYSDVEGYFVPVNCSAVPKELFESEFFGYEEGAFTGAKKGGKKGLFELANNGTIFLDEIADLPLFMQAKLLRVLQNKTIKKIGGEKELELNLRVISATNKDLSKMVEKGEFREDLYYRINVIKLNLPPLRERKEDIILLFQHFLEKIAVENDRKVPKVESKVMDIMMNYDWPGNARELKNAAEHILALDQEGIITVELVPHYIRDKVLSREDIDSIYTEKVGLKNAVEEYESSLIKQALNISDGNIRRAAELLKIPRTTLHSKINKYNI
ncbi:MAG: sigma-54 dependent transcriptional regulator PrdR [Bacillota bacterium]